MKKLLLVLAILAAVYLGADRFSSSPQSHVNSEPAPATDSRENTGVLEDLQSGSRITGEGIVTRVLADDTEGSRHQRFILELGSGRTLLIAHNVDLAPRIGSLREGDTVAFNGVYEWNDKGGLVHWTHHDPQGQHEPGWLRHDGRIYQ